MAGTFGCKTAHKFDDGTIASSGISDLKNAFIRLLYRFPILRFLVCLRLHPHKKSYWEKRSNRKFPISGLSLRKKIPRYHFQRIKRQGHQHSLQSPKRIKLFMSNSLIAHFSFCFLQFLNFSFNINFSGVLVKIGFSLTDDASSHFSWVPAFG